MAASEDLEAALARTRQSYDETPYLSTPLIRTQPGRLAARALWQGLAAPDARTARVLEIGCASGGNILPMAAGLPQAHFLGVDLSPRQIEAGETRRRRCGLDNVELRAASFEALGEADGVFDFIICHGVYAWIPEPLRDSLLRVIRERLAPNGLAMVSFNVLPGWRLFQIARDSMLLNARMIGDPARRAEATRELFGLLKEQTDKDHTYGKFWRDQAQMMAKGGDAYLAHEIFEEHNIPETFADFTGRAARFGLDYLGEAVVNSNSAADLAPNGADSIDALCGGDRLKRETYIDIFSGRTFREAVLTHKDRVDRLAPRPDPGTLASLQFIPALELELATARDREGVYRLNVKGNEITIENPAAGAPLRRLLERSPASSRPTEFVENAAEADAMLELLPAAVETGFLAISTLPVGCASRLSERPRLWRIAALEAQDSDIVTTLRHSSFKLLPLQRLLAPLIDGTRTKDELVAAAVELAQAGELTVNAPDGPVADAQEIRRRLESGVDLALAGLLRNGLLVDA